jgi:hypothetical protein
MLKISEFFHHQYQVFMLPSLAYENSIHPSNCLLSDFQYYYIKLLVYFHRGFATEILLYAEAQAFN